MGVSKAGYILALVAGIIDLVIGAIYLLMGGALAAAGGGIFGAFVLPFAIWFIVAGILMIVAQKKMRDPSRAKNGSMWALIVGILSFNVFAVVGGILGLVEANK